MALFHLALAPAFLIKLKYKPFDKPFSFITTVLSRQFLFAGINYFLLEDTPSGKNEVIAFNAIGGAIAIMAHMYFEGNSQENKNFAYYLITTPNFHGFELSYNF